MTDPPRRRRFTLSVRMLMLLVLVVAGWMAWVTNEARKQREAVAAIMKFGGWVHYDYEFANGKVQVPPGNGFWTPSWGKLTPGRSPRAPVWLRGILGDEYFRDIAHVSLFVDIAAGRAYAAPWNIGPADEVLAKLEGQTGVKTLQIGGQQATDRGLKYVGTMTGLEELIIWPAPGITDAGLVHLKGLKNLEILDIHNSQLTDRGLEQLKVLHKLKELRLGGAGITDAGVKRLQEAMPNLKSVQR